MKKYNLLLISFILLAIILVAITAYTSFSRISAKATRNNNSKLQVVTSFYPLYFFANEIGGEKTEIHNVTPAGMEPHDYEPTAQDMVKIESSRILILNGGHLEEWAERIEDTLENKNIEVVVASTNLIENDDPHVWLAPPLAKQEVDAIVKAFIKVDPADKSYYESNANILKQNLDALDIEYKTGLQNCKRKDFITSHDAFGYLAKQYGLQQVSIAGLSPEEEPSSKQLAEVADFAKKNNVKYIFFEELVSEKLAKTIAGEVGAQTLVLNPLEGLTKEDMQNGKNYFTIMRDNLINLRTALECQ